MKKGNNLLDKIKYPKDLRKLNDKQLKTVCKELRDEVVDACLLYTSPSPRDS